MDLRTASDLTPKEYHARRNAAARARREAFQAGKLDEARAAIRRSAPVFSGLRTVYLFGSVLDPRRFTECSDIERKMFRGLVDKMIQRSVQTYGAIYLRTDGTRAVIGQKFEQNRPGRCGTPTISTPTPTAG